MSGGTSIGAVPAANKEKNGGSAPRLVPPYFKIERIVMSSGHNRSHDDKKRKVKRAKKNATTRSENQKKADAK
jgi:hypothetical protein